MTKQLVESLAEEQPVKAEPDIHDTYYEKTRAVMDSQSEVMSAFINKHFPKDTPAKGLKDGQISTGTRNFTAKHYPEGHGVVKHYNTIECIRTKSGLIIDSADCFTKGFARCTAPPKSKRDARLPLNGMNDKFMQMKHYSIYDITWIYEHRGHRDSQVAPRSTKQLIVYFDDAPPIFLSHDNQSMRRWPRQRVFMFPLTEEEFSVVESVYDVYDFILPAPVRAASEEGRAVKRQGNVWFVEIEEDRVPPGTERWKPERIVSYPDGKKHVGRATEGADWGERTIVRGQVLSSRRRFPCIYLDGWHQVVYDEGIDDRIKSVSRRSRLSGYRI